LPFFFVLSSFRAFVMEFLCRVERQSKYFVRERRDPTQLGADPRQAMLDEV